MFFYICPHLIFMKGKWLYVITLFLIGMFAFSFTEARNSVPLSGTKSILIIKSSSTNSQKQPLGSSPFIRFHSGIDESSVTISLPVQPQGHLKTFCFIPEKFARIIEYLSSLSFRLPIPREFLYSTPLRSPPIFC